jgi:TPR repeat protein
MNDSEQQQSNGAPPTFDTDGYLAALRVDKVPRPYYGYSLLSAAVLARELGHKAVTALEFGVARGDGLSVLERHAEFVEVITGISVRTIGFDRAKGLPDPVDQRDMPHVWQEAMKWYRKAAEQEDELAQLNLGVMYYKGTGVLQDTIAAHMWFNIAAANGNKGAVKNRDIAAGKLSSSDIVKAQQMAKRCMASGFKDCD